MPGVTCNDFFGISINGFWTEARSELESVLRGGALRKLVPGQWEAIVSGVGTKTKELFDIDLAWFAVSAWSKYRELTKYADPEKHPPGESNFVPLAKHTLTVGYHPYLEILFNGKPLTKLVFDLTLSLDLEGFVLTIENGKIMKVRTGSCQGKGKIAFKGQALVEKPLTKITFPGTIELPNGISLAKPENKRKEQVESLPRPNSARIDKQPDTVEISGDEGVENVSLQNTEELRESRENRVAETSL
jgi:hypothetical protein